MSQTLIRRELDAEHHVMMLTLDRPEALNALNRQVMQELRNALDECERAEHIRVVLLKGSDKAFAAGADIKEMVGLSPLEMKENGYLEMWDGIAHYKKPLVAAVSGYALGGGLELALLADILVASETAKFGFPEVTLGVIPGAGGTQRFARAVGHRKAMEYILTGTTFTAKEAYEMGLLNHVFPQDIYIAEAQKIAQEIAKKAPLAVLYAKEAIKTIHSGSLTEGIEAERMLFSLLFSTEDMKEGMTAFIEKRKPIWKGK